MQTKEYFNQLFKKFTDVVGGDNYELCNILYNHFEVENEAFYLNFDKINDYFENKVIPHKIAVYNYGINLLNNEKISGCLSDSERFQFKYNLWIHDLSKFSINESIGYALNDFTKDEVSLDFERAWLHHKNYNPHHPEYYMNTDKAGVIKPLPIPLIYLIEMIADLGGAGQTYNESLESWLPKNLPIFKFNETTTMFLKVLLSYIGFNTEIKDNHLYVVS